MASGCRLNPTTNRYHAHDRATLQDGLYGAIQIRYVYPTTADLVTELMLSRPSEARENPFSMISNETDDINAMKQAERHTIPVILSDWDHLTSVEYMEAMEATGYDILYVPPCPPQLLC